MLGLDEDLDAMWLCPHCAIWVGTKLDTCSEGHERPRIPVTHDDVAVDDSRHVARTDRIRVKARKLLGWPP